MSKTARSLLVVMVLAALVLIGALIFALTPTRTHSIAATPAPDAAAIMRGHYIALAADCTACHTAANGKAFAGGRAIASPIGTIYSTNITPDRETGIGNFTLDQFDRAVRHGIDDEGNTLYPAMPYPS